MAVGVAEQHCQEREGAPGVDEGAGPDSEGEDAEESPGDALVGRVV